MKPILGVLFSLSFLSLAAQAAAQTVSSSAAALREAANATVCESYDLPTGCSDAQAQAAWCAKTGIQAEPAMCAASDKRTAQERIVGTDAVFLQGLLAAESAAKAERLRRARVATIIKALESSSPSELTAACLALNVCPK